MNSACAVWLVNTKTGKVLAARARDEDDLNGGAPVVNYDSIVTRDDLIAMKDDLLVPRLYCTTHGVWEGKPFTLGDYLDEGGLGVASYGEKRLNLDA